MTSGKGSPFPSTRQPDPCFGVVGVPVDYTSDQGSLLMDRDMYVRYWKDDRVDTFDLMLKKGSNPESVRSRQYSAVCRFPQYFHPDKQGHGAELNRLTDQFLSLQYVQLIVAVLVAVSGSSIP